MKSDSLKPALPATKPARRVSAGLALTCVLALLPASGLLAQRTIDPNYSHPQMSDPMAPMAGNPMSTQMEIKRLDALNTERQKSLVADTNKLLKLTADLNVQINGTHPATLTEAQLRMVAEIEKLAHSIREKMSTPVNGNPRLGPAPPPMMLPPSPLR